MLLVCIAFLANWLGIFSSLINWNQNFVSILLTMENLIYVNLWAECIDFGIIIQKIIVSFLWNKLDDVVWLAVDRLYVFCAISKILLILMPFQTLSSFTELIEIQSKIKCHFRLALIVKKKVNLCLFIDFSDLNVSGMHYCQYHLSYFFEQSHFMEFQSTFSSQYDSSIFNYLL